MSSEPPSGDAGAQPALPLGPVTRPAVLRKVSYAVGQLARFTWLEVQCCLFPLAIFAGLAASAVIELPILRYDALLIYALAVTALFWVLRRRPGERSR